MSAILNFNDAILIVKFPSSIQSLRFLLLNFSFFAVKMSSRTSSNVIVKRRAHSKKNREEEIHESGNSESDSLEPGAVPKKPNRKSVKFAKLRVILSFYSYFIHFICLFLFLLQKIGTRKPPQERKLCTGRKTRNARIAKVHVDVSKLFK